MTRIRLDFAVAAVVLMPFVTVGLDFRVSLIVKAAGILAIVLATLPALATAEGRSRVLAAPRPVVLGILAVVAATVMGTGVGLIRGHALSQIAGQALSMGLLPLAAIGGLATWRDSRDKRWETGLLAALTLGCWIQLIWGFVQITILGAPSRLFLPNSVSVIGPALMGLCFSLVSLADPNPRLRRLAWLATLSILLVILGSSLRSLWILTPLVIVGIAVVWRGMRSREAGVALAAVVGIVLTMVSGVWLLKAWVAIDRPDILQQSPCSLFPNAGHCVDDVLDSVPENGRRLRHDAVVDLPEAEGWRITVQGHGEGQGAIVVALVFLDQYGRQIGKIPIPIRAGEQKAAVFNVGPTPQGAAKARLSLSRWKGTRGRWRIDEIKCAPLENSLMIRLSGKALAVQERARSLVRAGRTLRIDGDATLGFRWQESVRILETLDQAPWLNRLFGHGLGATVHLDIDGFDNRGHWVHFDDVNYIHNWYLFLLFKLGIVGTVLVLGSLLGWIIWTARPLFRTVDPDTRAFRTAAAAAWIIYAIWSLTSPEILDYRMAPLWGWLLSVTASREFRLCPSFSSDSPEP